MISAVERGGSEVPASLGVLVLASSQHAGHPYDEWLADLKVPLLAIGDESAPPRSNFSRVVLVQKWDDDELVGRALTLHSEVGFDRVIGLGEVDIIPAARIRESLGLIGQWEASAEVYRDKLKMREEAAAHGIPVPGFARADDSHDVARFIESAGLPVMVKPRMGLGALGIRRVDDLSAVAELTFPEGPGHYLVETFVDGPTFHVNAIRLGGESMITIPCAYVGAGCISHWTDDGIGSFTLPPDHPLSEPLTAAASNLAEAFPGPPDLAIHAEFFAHDGEILLCEVASRGGGGAIPLLMKRFLGMDIRHLWARLQCGLPIDWNELERRLQINPLTASMGLPRRKGRLSRLPDEVPADVLDLEYRSTQGEDFTGEKYARRHSGDFVAAWTVIADMEAGLLKKLEDTTDAMSRTIEWDLEPIER